MGWGLFTSPIKTAWNRAGGPQRKAGSCHQKWGVRILSIQEPAPHPKPPQPLQLVSKQLHVPEADFVLIAVILYDRSKVRHIKGTLEIIYFPLKMTTL